MLKEIGLENWNYSVSECLRKNIVVYNNNSLINTNEIEKHIRFILSMSIYNSVHIKIKEDNSIHIKLPSKYKNDQDMKDYLIEQLSIYGIDYTKY